MFDTVNLLVALIGAFEECVSFTGDKCFSTEQCGWLILLACKSNLKLKLVPAIAGREESAAVDAADL